MPMGMDPLAPSEIELFRRWIGEGARDDTASGMDAGSPILHSARNALAPGSITRSFCTRRRHRHCRSPRGPRGAASAAYSKDGKMLVAVGGSPLAWRDTVPP
jgi:hypothetical protein